jgi:hypothetical protein
MFDFTLGKTSIVYLVEAEQDRPKYSSKHFFEVGTFVSLLISVFNVLKMYEKNFCSKHKQKKNVFFFA